MLTHSLFLFILFTFSHNAKPQKQINYFADPVLLTNSHIQSKRKKYLRDKIHRTFIYLYTIVTILRTEKVKRQQIVERERKKECFASPRKRK